MADTDGSKPPYDGPATVTGGCLCGAIRFEADMPPKFRVRCHCTICRRRSGADNMPFVGFDEGRLRLTKGSVADLSGYNTSTDMTRYVCKACGGPVYNEALSGDLFRDTPLHTVDAVADHTAHLAPKIHINYEMRVADHTDGLPKFYGMFLRPMADAEVAEPAPLPPHLGGPPAPADGK